MASFSAASPSPPLPFATDDVSNMFAKLGVSGRAEAVARARDADLGV